MLHNFDVCSVLVYFRCNSGGRMRLNKFPFLFSPIMERLWLQRIKRKRHLYRFHSAVKVAVHMRNLNKHEAEKSIGKRYWIIIKREKVEQTKCKSIFERRGGERARKGKRSVRWKGKRRTWSTMKEAFHNLMNILQYEAMMFQTSSRNLH